MKFTSTNKPISINALENIIYFFKTGKKAHSSTPNFLCEGFCLFAAIVALNLSEEDFSFYKNEVRDEDIKTNLLKIDKHKSKNSKQLDDFIEKNNKIDIRNAFFHGNFEIIQDEGFNWFMLEPQRPHNPSDFPIAISFNEIYKALIDKFARVRSQYLAQPNHTQEEKSSFTYKFFALPFIEMAGFYSGKKIDNFQTKEFILSWDKMLGLVLLNISNVFEQNELIPFLKDSEQKAKLCLFRNSSAHGLMNFDENKMKFVEIDTKNSKKKEISLNSKEFMQEMIKIHASAFIGLIDEFDREIEKIAASQPIENKEEFIKKSKSTHQKAYDIAKEILARAEECTDKEKED